ncbi:MAG: DUF6640 family protein [Bryobacteraceae bacterium]
MSERLLSSRNSIARGWITLLLAGSTVASFLLDWSPNHLLNPAWHPHARFHGGLLLFFLAGTSASLLWLIWRRPGESSAAIRAAAGVMMAYWSPLLFVPLVLPGSSWWAGTPGEEPRWGGQVVYPNLVVAGLMIVASLAAWWLCDSE